MAKLLANTAPAVNPPIVKNKPNDTVIYNGTEMARKDAQAETMRALEMYRAFAEEQLALPVIVGEKPENERFPGAAETRSIEAMMQDG